MTVTEMVNQLGLRVEDTAKQALNNAARVAALNNAQVRVAALLDPGYLTQLEVQDANTSAASGVIDISDGGDLDNDVLRGADGIQRVKVYGSLECTRIEMADIKQQENDYKAASFDHPLFYIHSDNIYLLPSTIAAADVYYRKKPTTLAGSFTMAASGTPGTQAFLGTSGEGLSDSDDAYNGLPIYVVGKDEHHIIADYDVAGAGDGNLLFTTEHANATNFGADTFYFLTHAEDSVNLAGVTSELDSSLHPLILDLAEAELWGMVGDLERKNGVIETAGIEIKMLNENMTRGVDTKASRLRRR